MRKHAAETRTRRKGRWAILIDDCSAAGTTILAALRAVPVALRLAQGQTGPPLSADAFQRQLVEKISQNCPNVEWRSSFAVLGPYDFPDIFSAPDIDSGMRVAATVRGTGHAHIEIWGAAELHHFMDTVRAIHPSAG